MKITVFGAGYVGLVTAACFAAAGNHVVCADINQDRIDQLNQGICPIYEPGLSELIQQNLAAGQLHFTTDIKKATTESLYLFIAVGTPSLASGAADLSYVFQVATSIAEHINQYALIISKSTVPVGTAEAIKKIIAEKTAARQLTIQFDVASNPEFLCQGAAIQDFTNSDRIVVGTESDYAKDHLLALYAPFNQNNNRIICMDLRSAELTKYAANAMLASRISFINELSLVAEAVQADIATVLQGVGADPRIGPKFLNPGCGYGGSCFPKDVQALEQIGLEANIELPLIHATHATNERQKRYLFHKIRTYFAGQLQGKTIALWGLSFKPNTDDMREAPSRTLMEALWQQGAIVKAYDPIAMPEAARIYGARKDLILCDSKETALQSADALAIVTEWSDFTDPDLAQMKILLKNPVIFDGRNLYNPESLKTLGFHYYAIGRGENQPYKKFL